MPRLLGQRQRTWLEGRGRPQEVMWHPVLPPCPPVLQVSAPGSVLWVGDGLLWGAPGAGGDEVTHGVGNFSRLLLLTSCGHQFRGIC